MMKHVNILIIIISSLIIFAGCSDNKNTQKISRYLQETVEIEKQFEKEGQEIYELEKKDEVLYEEMISLGDENFDEIVQLAKEANELVAERRRFTDKEKETMVKSKEAFIQVETLAEKYEEQDKELEELVNAMLERYELYDEVYEKYMNALDNTEQLYTLFQKKETTDKKIYAMLNQINDSYEEVQEAYESFNLQTEKFNELKKQYIDTLEG